MLEPSYASTGRNDTRSSTAFSGFGFVGFSPTPQEPVDRLRLRFFDLSRRPRGDAIGELCRRIPPRPQRLHGKSYLEYLKGVVWALEELFLAVNLVFVFRSFYGMRIVAKKESA